MSRVPGHRRPATEASNRRQRPIQATLAVLLVIPLISLIALWAYAATSTISGAVGKYDSDTLDKDMGAVTQSVIQQVDAERADTFIFQNGRGRIPRSTLTAQREKTDAAVKAFRAGLTNATGYLNATGRSLAATVIAQLGQLPAIRAKVDAGTLAPLPAFTAYDTMMDTFFPFSRGALSGWPGEPLPLFELGEGGSDEGQAVELISREAALVGGVLVRTDRMSAAEHQLFTQFVDDQRLLEQVGGSPQFWQQIPDPYTPVLTSATFVTFQTLENRITAARAGGLLPIGGVAWQGEVESVLKALTQAETTLQNGATKGAGHAGDVILLRLFGIAGAGLAAVIVSVALLLGFGRRISRELRGLRQSARELAEDRLPSVMSRLSQGSEVDVDAEAPPLALRTRTREVTETAVAFSEVRRTAVEAAVGQARLRQGVSNVFRSLARRNQSLLQRQLRMLDEMERGTEDPEALARLFRLDHLTTRMRRQAEGLIILSGAAPGRGWREPVAVVEVLRGAVGEIEDYVRVDLQADSRDLMNGTAIADVTHLLAELIENAALYSPPDRRVKVTSGRVANGYVVEIEDRGLGMPPDMLIRFNELLAHPPEFDLADSDQLGLFVVSRLAARHGISVALRSSANGGTVAIVLLPRHLMVGGEEEGGSVDTTKTAPVSSPAFANSQPVAAPPWEFDTNFRGISPEPSATPGDLSSDGPRSDGSLFDRLPRRQRQAHLAPQLREAQAGDTGGHRRVRSADQARSLISSMQQGWRTGRVAADLDNDDEGENA